MTLVAAASENGFIGKNGALPWRVPEELKLFRRLTWGGTVVVGRKTFEAPGFPLPGRKNVVISRMRDDSIPPENNVFVIGGAEIFRLFWPRINIAFLSLIHTEIDGDVRLPDEILHLFSKECSTFELVERRFYPALPVPFTFYRFHRIE